MIRFCQKRVWIQFYIVYISTRYIHIYFDKSILFSLSGKAPTFLRPSVKVISTIFMNPTIIQTLRNFITSLGSDFSKFRFKPRFNDHCSVLDSMILRWIQIVTNIVQGSFILVFNHFSRILVIPKFHSDPVLAGHWALIHISDAGDCSESQSAASWNFPNSVGFNISLVHLRKGLILVSWRIHWIFI